MNESTDQIIKTYNIAPYAARKWEVYNFLGLKAPDATAATATAATAISYAFFSFLCNQLIFQNVNSQILQWQQIWGEMVGYIPVFSTDDLWMQQ